MREAVIVSTARTAMGKGKKGTLKTVRPDDMAALRANAERLARIIVSDILLYYPEQVEAGLASGRLAEALGTAIEEGRGFFAQRVDPRVRDERDYIVEEVQRVAEERTGR